MTRLRARSRLVAAGVAVAALAVTAGCGGGPAAPGRDATHGFTAREASYHSTADAAPAATDPIWVRIHKMSLINRVRQLMVLTFNGTHVPTSIIERMHPGGLIYFGQNLTTQAQTEALSKGIQRAAIGHTTRLLLMTDQEGGSVVRIPGTEGTPGGADFHGHAVPAHDTAVSTGQLMDRLEVNTNLAPDADVNTVGSGGVIGDRSFGSTPGVVSRLTTAQVCGYHEGGIATTVKHFPGHGSTRTDSHLHTAVIHESKAKWAATDLPPFETAVKDDVDMILVGHLAFPAMDPTGRPATISYRLNHMLLRDRLGFQGVVITDALNMGGITSWGTPAQIAVKTIKAGSDMLLMSPQPVAAIHAIVDAVNDGTINLGRLDMSVYRVLKLKQELGLLRPAKSLPQC